MPLFRQAEFFQAVHDPADLPPDVGVEIAFAGRSNAGKSSAINAIVNRRRLAFVSKTPGRTQTINFFSIGAHRFLVDLPGYGYAAVPSQERRHWGSLISAYIQTRASLRGLIVIMDARRPFTVLDRQLLDWIASLGKPGHVLLTKADKLTRRDAVAALQRAQAVTGRFANCSVQLFSGTTRQGVDAAQDTIAQWLRKSDK